MKFVNFSNHASKAWTKEQTEAALGYGEITDYPFPAVASRETEEGICAMADRIVAEIMELEPAAVMCQGEFSLVFAVACRLIKRNVPVLSACSERMVEETEDGKKIVSFKFEKFREYNKVLGN